MGLWWLLMLDGPAPTPGVRAAAERLSGHDQAALDRLLQRAQP
jgi:hypothetical protein